ncbi:MAG: VWA domain-containing protein [Planctomycetaceae bacterium]|nr:VWA domain-containing protein [Planctomycetaceae bacterium]
MVEEPAMSLLRPLIVAAVTALIVLTAEFLHLRRIRRLQTLLFGTDRRAFGVAITAAAIRIMAVSCVAGCLTFLILLPAQPLQSDGAREVPYNKLKHIVLVLDVSPSMRLQDAGAERDISRMSRAREVMQSYFDRVPMNEFRVSVVATYTDAFPVVEATKDIGVLNNILADLPMHFAFPPGDTDLFAGIRAAAQMARPWRPRSTTVVIISDGDTVPATGMPKLPAAVADVVVVGVGDAQNGSFIAGRNSRQDVSTLRQIAARLGGIYHNGNEQHLSTELIQRLTRRMEDNDGRTWNRRDLALLFLGVASLALAILPLLLHYYGTHWQPGIRPSGPRASIA